MCGAARVGVVPNELTGVAHGLDRAAGDAPGVIDRGEPSSVQGEPVEHSGGVEVLPCNLSGVVDPEGLGSQAAAVGRAGIVDERTHATVPIEDSMMVAVGVDERCHCDTVVVDGAERDSLPCGGPRVWIVDCPISPFDQREAVNDAGGVDVTAGDIAVIVDALRDRSLPRRRARFRVVQRGEVATPEEKPVQHADAVDVVPDHGAARVDAQGIGPLKSPGSGMGIVDRSEPAVVVEEAEALVGAVVVVADHRTMFVDARWKCSLASGRAGGGDIDGDEPAVAGRAGLDRREHQRCHGKKDDDHASLHLCSPPV